MAQEKEKDKQVKNEHNDSVSAEENKSTNEKISDKPKKSEKKEKSDKEAPNECENLKAEIEKLKDAHMRCAAEYANYRARTDKERAEIYTNATMDAIKNILPIADSIEMALASLKDASDDYKKGIELIKAQFDKALSELKVESFGEVGDKFDPALYNAIAKIEDESLEENVVSAVFQKGYKCKDKIIRYCMVQVAN